MEVPFGALSKNEGHGWPIIVRTQSSGIPRASQGQPGTLGTQLYSGGTRQRCVPPSLPNGFQDMAAPLNCAACCGEGVWDLPRERGKCTAVNVAVPKNHLTRPSLLSVDKDFQGQALSLEGPSIQIPLVGKPKLLIS